MRSVNTAGSSYLTKSCPQCWQTLRTYAVALLGCFAECGVRVGAILYTSYLQALAMIYAPSSHNAKRINPPPSPLATFAAGASAGALQSVVCIVTDSLVVYPTQHATQVAAPLDALQTRFNTNSMLQGEYTSMWQYARSKLREIGVRGVFAGWSLSLVIDSLGYGAFFAAFETVKTQAYYSFLTQYYGYYKPVLTSPQGDSLARTADNRAVIKPHYAVEPTFLLLAGISAGLAQQAVQHPLSTIQEVHYSRLESLDYAAKQDHSRRKMLRMYYRAYQMTYDQCKIQASKVGGWRKYLYKSFWRTTIGQVPSTAAGLVVFELVRRKYAVEDEVVRIQKDGFDILLS